MGIAARQSGHARYWRCVGQLEVIQNYCRDEDEDEDEGDLDSLNICLSLIKRDVLGISR